MSVSAGQTRYAALAVVARRRLLKMLRSAAEPVDVAGRKIQADHIAYSSSRHSSGKPGPRFVTIQGLRGSPVLEKRIVVL